jgi:hypothetical protein
MTGVTVSIVTPVIAVMYTVLYTSALALGGCDCTDLMLTNHVDNLKKCNFS